VSPFTYEQPTACLRFEGQRPIYTNLRKEPWGNRADEKLQTLKWLLIKTLRERLHLWDQRSQKHVANWKIQQK
jgi:hypothetical protein